LAPGGGDTKVDAFRSSTLATVFFSMTVGLGLAYLAYNRVRGITAYRTLLIWPYAISPPVAGILFFMMFNSTGGIFAAAPASVLPLPSRLLRLMAVK
jgi:ABC-type sugar transport system permease subunit